MDKVYSMYIVFLSLTFLHSIFSFGLLLLHRQKNLSYGNYFTQQFIVCAIA